MLQGEGICMESLVDMLGLVSVHSTTCNKRGWVYKPNKCDSLIQLEQGKENKQSKHSNKNVFWTLRHCLLRNQIFSLISKGFYLSPRGEVIRLMLPRAVLPGDI